MTQDKQKVLFGFLLALGLGIGLGAWAMRLHFDRTLAQWDPAQRLALRLAGDLDLSAAQQGQVAEILAKQKARMEQRRQAWGLEVRGLARQGEDQIAALLTPAQAQAFMRLHDSFHGRMDRFLWSAEEAPSAVALGGDTSGR